MHIAPPTILIELYFSDDPVLTQLKGIVNSRRENVPGVVVSIDLNAEFKEEYARYVTNPSIV